MTMIKNIMVSVVAIMGFALQAVDTAPMPTNKAELKDLVKETVTSVLGFIDPLYILESSDEFKEAIKQLEKKFLDGKKELVSLEDSMKKIDHELKTMSNTLSQAAKEKKEEEIANLGVKRNLKEKNLELECNKMQQDLQMRLLKEIQASATEIAQEEGRVLVHAGGLVFGIDPMNMSEKVLKRVNKKYQDSRKEMVKKETMVANAAPKTKVS